MDKFIEMLRVHEESEDPRIVSLAENLDIIGKIAPNFGIFESEKCSFMHTFKAYEISKDTDMIVAAHEFGHAVLSIMNETKVPENYGQVIKKAKEYALAPENKEKFKAYVEYIAGKTDRKEERTEGEKGPVSDVMSLIFQREALEIGSKGNLCIFSSFHDRGYYFDEEKGEPKLKEIFDENFANYYTLKVNNYTKEIETIRELFGDELVDVLDIELEKAYTKLINIVEKGLPETKKDQWSR